MNLKEIDFKQLMIDKGEKVALGVIGALAGLLILFGFVMRGLGSGSASANAKAIMDLKKSGQDRFNSSRPPADLINVDPELMQAGKLEPLDPVAFLAENPFFVPLQQEDTKWRKPKVLAPDETQVELFRTLIWTYIATRDKNSLRVKFLKPVEKKDARPNQPAGNVLGSGKFAGGQGGSSRLQQMFGGKGGGGMGGPGGMMGGMMGGPGGMMGRGGMMGGPGGMMGGMMGGPGGMMGMMAGGGEKQELQFVDVPIENLTKDALPANAWPAKQAVPVRMAVIHAAFPYKEQMEEFRRALRYHSMQEMEQEAAAEYSGLDIQRREIGSDGKPGEWRDLNVADDLRWPLIFGREPEDPKLLQYGIVWHKDRLVIPRPMLARDEDKYPEPKLEGIRKVIEAFDKVAKDALPPPMENKAHRFGGAFDIYDSEPNADASGGAAAGGGVLPPGLAEGGDTRRGMMMNPGGGPMGAAGGMADMMRKNMQQMKQRMGGEVGGAVPPGLGMMAGGYAAGAMQSEPLVPDKCLVRFVDITVQPGHTYEYQVRVRMGNPLYQKPEKAISLEFTKDKEVTGEWARIPHKLTVPEETEFYVVDERTTKSRSAVSQDQLPMQIHRWFDWMQIAQNVREAIVPVGDWTIAERVPVARGEYIGTMKEVEVPTWYPLQEAFGFAVPPEQRRKNYTRPRGGKGIKVPFGTQSILIDFQGGRQEVAVKGRDTKVRDECPVEALILTPDGKLRLRSSKADTELATRKERVKHWHEWLKEVKEGKERKPAQDNLFGPPGAAGGAGAGANNN